MVWIPKRCEAPGCNNRQDLKRCQTCSLVMYCSKECQKKDWKRHKLDCAHCLWCVEFSSIASLATSWQRLLAPADDVYLFIQRQAVQLFVYFLRTW
jgi:MYND finger